MKRVISLLLGICLLFTASVGVFASAYDEALKQLTDPQEQQMDAALRHEYAEDERINATAAVYQALSDDGVAKLWSVNPEGMRSLSLSRLHVLIEAGEEGKELPDPETATDLELLSLITNSELTVTDTAPLFEQSWYDYGVMPSNYSYRYAKKNISGYMFAITCDGKYLALCKASYTEQGDFAVDLQAYPNICYSLYQTALSHTREGSYPILLLDPVVHDAVAFMVSNGDVYVKNAVSSSSKDEILQVDAVVFAQAATKWNRDALSMLVDASGRVQSLSKLEYNNLESYVRSELRVAIKENLMRAACVFFSTLIVLVMVVLLINKRRIRFLDEDDPKRKWGYLLSVPVQWVRQLIEKVKAR